MKIQRLVLSVFAVILTAAASLPIHAQITEPDNHKVVFRYRSYTGATPSYVSPNTQAGTSVTTIDRGVGFDSLLVTNFAGAGNVRATAAISTVDATGDDSFAIEAWFKASDLSGTRTLLSNTQGGGFSLKVVAGVLRGEVRWGDGSTGLLSQSGSLSTGVWYYAVFHVSKGASNYQMRLYLDGVKVGDVTTASLLGGVNQSAEFPMVGAEPDSGVAASSLFNGQIYGVAVSNHYVYLDNYVKNKVVRDGSRYFGMLGYHDYLSTTASVDFRIQATITSFPDLGSTKVVDRLQLPLLNDGYIPQGLGYDAANGLLYVSYYWKGDDGQVGGTGTGQDPEKLSVVAEIEKSTNKLRRIFRLNRPPGSSPIGNYGHVGGLEYYNGALYIAFGTSVYRYPLASAPNPSYVFNPQTFANPRGDQNLLSVVTTNPLATALTAAGNTGIDAIHISTDTNGDKLLWVSDYEDAAMKIVGFKINADGSIASTATYIFNLPTTKVNGMVCYNTTATQFKFYTVRAGVWTRVTYNKTSATPVSTVTPVFTGPGGTEDLTIIGSEIWTSNESGGRFYQKGAAPWDDLYPFVFGVVP